MTRLPLLWSRLRLTTSIMPPFSQKALMAWAMQSNRSTGSKAFLLSSGSVLNQLWEYAAVEPHHEQAQVAQQADANGVLFKRDTNEHQALPDPHPGSLQSVQVHGQGAIGPGALVASDALVEQGLGDLLDTASQRIQGLPVLLLAQRKRHGVSPFHG